MRIESLKRGVCLAPLSRADTQPDVPWNWGSSMPLAAGGYEVAFDGQFEADTATQIITGVDASHTAWRDRYAKPAAIVTLAGVGGRRHRVGAGGPA